MGNQDDPVFSMKLHAGKKRTYFFDIRATRSDDYFLTITESKRRFNGEGYERHKLFIYKEDLNDFAETLEKTINHIKTELMPDYDFDEFKKEPEQQFPPGGGGHKAEGTSTNSPEDAAGEDQEKNEDTGEKDKDDDAMKW